MGRVKGKVALVTGGASGLGAAQCKMLAKEGAKVAVTDINEDGAKAVASEICQAGGEAIFLKHDVTLEADWKRTVTETVKQLGGLDILVNNAGIVIPKTVEDTSLEEWRLTLAINLDGVFLGTNCAVAVMKENGGGSIVNISSIEGIVGEPMAAAYNASKGGVRIFTKSVALHCADNGYDIRVNSVHPGFFPTPMMIGGIEGMSPEQGAAFKQRIEKSIPLKRVGDLDDIAYGVLFLASDESKYMTGTELIIDGGYTAR